MEKQNSLENLTSSSMTNQESLATSVRGRPEKSTTKEGNTIYSVMNKAAECHHSFKRVRPNQIECTKCGFGFFDSPDEPFLLTR
jgi:hypothetical protein